MLLNEYQKEAATFRVAGSPNEERVMGLLAEAGEVAGVFQKMLRGGIDPYQSEKNLYKELGDVLWYISQIAFDNEWTLQEIAEANINKLSLRKEHGLIITR